MRAFAESSPSLLHQVLLRLVGAMLLAALAAGITDVLVRPVELEHELDALARAFRDRLRESGRRDGQQVVQLEVDSRLYGWLARIPGLHLRVYDPIRRAVLFSYDHDRSTADVMLPLLSWPPGFFELREDGGDDAGEVEYGYVAHLPLSGGRELRLVIRRGPPQLRDHLYGFAAEFGHELLPGMLAVMVAGSLAVAVGLRRALAPLERLSHLAARLDPLSGRQLSVKGVPVEILPLVESVNRLLARLRDLLDRQRRFNAFAAHELRTLLAVLRARIEGLPEDLPERAALLRTLDRTARLVDDLLALARIGGGLVVPDEEADLRGVVREVAEEFAPLVLARGLDFEVDLPERPVPARIHRDALARALANLLDNALKYGASGGWIALRLLPDGRIVVDDRGPGLPDGEAEALFEPFARCRPRGSDPGGSGLGLALVREVAELHGGRAFAERSDTGGARIGLHIPVYTTLRRQDSSFVQAQLQLPARFLCQTGASEGMVPIGRKEEASHAACIRAGSLRCPVRPAGTRRAHLHRLGREDDRGAGAEDARRSGYPDHGMEGVQRRLLRGLW